MYIAVVSAVIVNMLAIIVMLIGLIYDFKQPKIKAVYGYFIAASMLIYMIILGLVAIYGLVVNHNFYSLVLFLCVISPFIIGKLVKYETLKKYTTAQIGCYVLSLVTILLKF